MLAPDSERKLTEFLERVADIPWFAHAGERSARYVVAADAAVAWDDWNEQTLVTWLPHTKTLEEAGRRAVGDAAINEVFRRVSEAVQWPIRKGLQAYFESRPEASPNSECGADLGLWPEILESLERDVAWAAMEAILGEGCFFSQLLEVHREGRWPCSWDGHYPDGRLVVL